MGFLIPLTLFVEVIKTRFIYTCFYIVSPRKFQHLHHVCCMYVVWTILCAAEHKTILQIDSHISKLHYLFVLKSNKFKNRYIQIQSTSNYSVYVHFAGTTNKTYTNTSFINFP
uniref:Uncharacterized protein n=1 Tax=Cacopsylla melanoneura TaxID=428564 RepID=A0A8D9B576_9HEMI